MSVKAIAKQWNRAVGAVEEALVTTGRMFEKNTERPEAIDVAISLETLRRNLPLLKKMVEDAESIIQVERTVVLCCEKQTWKNSAYRLGAFVIGGTGIALKAAQNNDENKESTNTLWGRVVTLTLMVGGALAGTVTNWRLNSETEYENALAVLERIKASKGFVEGVEATVKAVESFLPMIRGGETPVEERLVRQAYRRVARVPRFLRATIDPRDIIACMERSKKYSMMYASDSAAAQRIRRAFLGRTFSEVRRLTEGSIKEAGALAVTTTVRIIPASAPRGRGYSDADSLGGSDSELDDYLVSETESDEEDEGVVLDDVRPRMMSTVGGDAAALAMAAGADEEVRRAITEGKDAGGGDRKLSGEEEGGAVARMGEAAAVSASKALVGAGVSAEEELDSDADEEEEVGPLSPQVPPSPGVADDDDDEEFDLDAAILAWNEHVEAVEERLISVGSIISKNRSVSSVGLEGTISMLDERIVKMSAIIRRAKLQRKEDRVVFNRPVAVIKRLARQGAEVVVALIGIGVEGYDFYQEQFQDESTATKWIGWGLVFGAFIGSQLNDTLSVREIRRAQRKKELEGLIGRAGFILHIKARRRIFATLEATRKRNKATTVRYMERAVRRVRVPEDYARVLDPAVVQEILFNSAAVAHYDPTLPPESPGQRRLQTLLRGCSASPDYDGAALPPGAGTAAATGEGSPGSRTSGTSGLYGRGTVRIAGIGASGARIPYRGRRTGRERRSREIDARRVSFAARVQRPPSRPALTTRGILRQPQAPRPPGRVRFVGDDPGEQRIEMAATASAAAEAGKQAAKDARRSPSPTGDERV